MKACPGKVANVMLNSISLQFLYLLTPVQDGKWETAFAMLDNPNVGFDFGAAHLELTGSMRQFFEHLA